MVSGLGGAWRALVEKADLDLELARDLLHARAADAIDAFFIFLDLLEGDAELVAERFLAEVEFQAPHADPAADMLVDGIGRSWLHRELRGAGVAQTLVM